MQNYYNCQNQFDNIERIEEINIVIYYSGKREKIIKVKYIIII